MRVPNYKILELLSSGGMGSVYLAQDERLPRKVAIKVVKGDGSEDAHRRLVTEARIAAALSHPNICTVFEVGETDDGRPFIVMEYLPEPTLAEVRLTAAQVLEVGIQAADALAEAHSHGVVHRDIKPGNLVRTKRGHLKVLDFGIAAIRSSHGLALHEASDDVATSSRGAGTLAFMSPEQVRRDAIDYRSDIFSLGATLYILATGVPPFVGSSAGELCRAICDELPLPVSTSNQSFPKAFDRIIETAMEKKPESRFSSASAMKVALEHVARAYQSHEVSQPSPVAGGSTRIHNVLPERPRLVVLPLVASGPDDSDRALCQGIANAIASAIGQPRLGVWSRYCVLPMSDVQSRDVQTVQAAQSELGASVVLTGTVTRGAGQVSVLLQLVDAADSRVLSATRVERRSESEGLLEEEILHEVLKLLEIDAVEVGTDDETRSLGSTRDASAYSLYLAGIGHLTDFQDVGRVRAAIEVLERAVESDPQFALAYAKLGEACWRMYERTKGIQWTERAKMHCRRAGELERSLPQIHVTLGLVAHGLGRSQEALQSLLLAKSLDATNPEVLLPLGRVYEALRDYDSAEQALRLAVRVKPDYWGSHNALGAFLYRRNRFDEAADQFAEVVRLIPDSGWGQSNLGSLYHAMGRLDEAEQMLSSSYDRCRDYTTASNLGTLCWSRGEFRKARQWFSEAIGINDRDHRMWAYRGASGYHADRSDLSWRDDTIRAIELAEAELAVDGNDDRAKASIVSYFGYLGDEARARAWLARMGPAEGWQPDLHLLIAIAFEMLGHRSEAVTHVNAARARGVHPAMIEGDPVLSRLTEGETDVSGR
ncbi:MAG: protein kinase [Candidatus Eisenbacteria bacterium]